MLHPITTICEIFWKKCPKCAKFGWGDF